MIGTDLTRIRATRIRATRIRATRIRASLILDLRDRYARDLGFNPRALPMGPLTFKLTGRILNNQFQAFPNEPELEVGRNDSGYYLFFNKLRLAGAFDGRPRVLNRALVDGRYRLQVMGRFYRTLTRDVDLPTWRQALQMDLEAGVDYPFGRNTTLLRGSLRHPDGAGMAGVPVSATGTPETFVTGSDGGWVLPFPVGFAGGNVTVTLGAATAAATVLAKSAASLPLTSLFGTVIDGHGLPIPNAVLTLAGYPGQTQTNRHGIWAYYFAVDSFPNNVAPPATTLTVTPANLPPKTIPNVSINPRQARELTAIVFP